MSPDPGAALGARLAHVFADTHARVRAATLPGETAARHRAVEATMESWEQLLAQHAKELIGDALDDPGVPEDMKAPLRHLVTPGHQVDFLLQLVVVPVTAFALAAAIQAPNITYWQQWAREKNPDTALSPPELAGLWVRSYWSREEVLREALKSGVNQERMEALAALATRPPAMMELLQAYRRGIIGDDRLDHGIHQSDVDNEWADVIKALRYAPPGAAEAVAAAVEGHLTVEEATAKAQEAGLAPDDFPWVYATHGNPPGTMELLHLMNRGEMTREEVVQGIRESHVKDKYIPALLKMARTIPPMRTIVAGISKGVFTHEEGITRLLQLGYNPVDAAALAAEASHDKTAGDKDLAKAQVVDGYSQRYFSRPRAIELLGHLGYSMEDAAFLLDLADHARERRFTDAAVNRAHALYVKRRLDFAATSNLLDRLEVPAAQRDDLLRLWDLERAADTPDLTVAQWQGVLRRGLVDGPRFLAEMTAKGYSDEEAQFLGDLAFPAPRAR